MPRHRKSQTVVPKPPARRSAQKPRRKRFLEIGNPGFRIVGCRSARLACGPDQLTFESGRSHLHPRRQLRRHSRVPRGLAATNPRRPSEKVAAAGGGHTAGNRRRVRCLSRFRARLLGKLARQLCAIPGNAASWVADVPYVRHYGRAEGCAPPECGRRRSLQGCQ